MTSREVKVRRRRITANPDLRNIRIQQMRKRKRDLFLRINYLTVLSAIVLPASAFIYLIHTHQSVVPQNTRTFWFLIIYYNITMLAFSTGYHKCYAHLTFRAKYGWLQLYFVVFGASVGIGSARLWAALHRCHHQFTDNPEKDPYSIKRGFLWAHWGWMLKRPKTTAFYREFIEHEFPVSQVLKQENSGSDSVDNEPDLDTGRLDSENVYTQPEVRDKSIREAQTLWWVVHLEQYTWLFFVFTTFLVPIAMTVFICHDSWVHGLIYPGILRMFWCQQLVLAPASLGHSRHMHVLLPSQPFSDSNSLVDCMNPVVAFLTYGQSHQNYHHEFPHDYRASLLSWALDPTKWFIWFLEKIGAVDYVGRTPQNLVVQLRLQQQQLVLNRVRSQLNWGTPISKLPHVSAKEFRDLCDSAAVQDRIYIVIQNIIHDVTPFMDQHPGGPSLLKASHGKDATRAFYGGVYGHLTAAVNLLATMRIGVMDGNDEDVWRRVVREEGDVADDSRNKESFRTAEAA